MAAFYRVTTAAASSFRAERDGRNDRAGRRSLFRSTSSTFGVTAPHDRLNLAKSERDVTTEFTTAWASIGDLVDALSAGVVPVGIGEAKPTPAAVHGVKIALKLLRTEGGALNPPPAVLTMPWGRVVFWWRTAPQRRIEIVGRNEAYEFIDATNGPRFRRFMSGPPADES